MARQVGGAIVLQKSLWRTRSVPEAAELTTPLPAGHGGHVSFLSVAV